MVGNQNKTLFQDFFKQIPKTIIPLTPAQNHQIISNYQNVSSLPEMEQFIMNSSSVYLTACWWLMKNANLLVFGKTRLYHIFPKFLARNQAKFWTNQLHKKHIFVHYNKVEVTRDIHMCLHILRYREFADYYDLLSVHVSIGPLKKKVLGWEKFPNSGNKKGF